MLDSLGDVNESIKALRGRASFFTKKRRADITLYRLIADCMALCEHCERERLTDKVRDAYASAISKDGKRRSYFERGSDVFRIIGRAVFDPDGSTGPQGGYHRYVVVMREAHKRQIAAADLAEYLANNGGVMALFNSRPTVAREVTTKMLHLTSPVTVRKGEAFTLRLRRLDTGMFEVLEAPGAADDKR